MKALKLLMASGAALALLAGAPVHAAETVKIGFVTFLSGPAAGPFGVPARNAAELIIDKLNAGEVPEPYTTKGIAKARIEPVIIDEAGGTQQQVAEYRKLVEKQSVDLVIGYISSGDCKAIAPVAEEVERLTVFFDCGTPQVFENVDTDPEYLFRTGPHATMDSVAAARYLLDLNPDIRTIAGINQNYAWGQDSWRDFEASMVALKPETKVLTDLFPKIFAGQYGSEISSLLTEQPDVVHSSFWGGDMEAFVLQASARGLFDESRVVLTTGETAMFRLGQQMPDGTVLGARGPHGVLAPESELNSWFREAYFDRYNTWPTYPSYKMAQAILGVKTAYEKAATGGGLPSQQAVITALEGLTFTSPSGEVRMALSDGHQAIQQTAYGVYDYNEETGQPTLTNVKYYAAECVNPPKDMKSLEWIQAGFPGAKCE